MNLYYLYLAEKMNRHEVFEQTNEANEPLLIGNKQERRNQSMPGKFLSDTTRGVGGGWGVENLPWWQTPGSIATEVLMLQHFYHTSKRMTVEAAPAIGQ